MWFVGFFWIVGFFFLACRGLLWLVGVVCGCFATGQPFIDMEYMVYMTLVEQLELVATLWRGL